MGIEDQYKFEEVTILSAFAIGVPGKRTFFLAIGEGDEWVRAWLEKDLLEALGSAVDQFFVTLSREQNISLDSGETDESLNENVPSGLPIGEFEIDEVSLGFDEGKATLNLITHAAGPRKEEQIEIDGRATLSQIKRLSIQSKKVCAAGRALCPLCGNPIEASGHICPRYN